MIVDWPGQMRSGGKEKGHHLDHQTRLRADCGRVMKLISPYHPSKSTYRKPAQAETYARGDMFQRAKIHIAARSRSNLVS